MEEVKEDFYSVKQVSQMTGYANTYIWFLCKAAKKNEYTFLRKVKVHGKTRVVRTGIVRVLESEDLEKIGGKWLVKASGVRKLLKHKKDKSDRAQGLIVS